jgi:hypothetical protein
MSVVVSQSHEDAWPAPSLAAWRDSYATLHLWTQVVGKTRLALAPMENHSDAALLQFIETTYEAAVIGGNWDRKAVERRA